MSVVTASAVTPSPGHPTPQARGQRDTLHFPRTDYTDLMPYLDPAGVQSARVLWAARDASAAWPAVLAQRDWPALNRALLSLVVFDKAYEMNAAQWGKRRRPTPEEWTDETNKYARDAFHAAVRAVKAVDPDQVEHLPNRKLVLRFCRAAHDLCASYIMDRCFRTSPLLRIPRGSRGPAPKPAVDDLVGRLCGRFDPLVLHAELLAEPVEMGRWRSLNWDYTHGKWVFDDEAEEPHGSSSPPGSSASSSD